MVETGADAQPCLAFLAEERRRPTYKVLGVDNGQTGNTVMRWAMYEGCRENRD
jgi:hypothetical protein